MIDDRTDYLFTTINIEHNVYVSELLASEC